MATRKKSEVVSEPETIPPVSAPRRRSTKPFFSSHPPTGRIPTRPGLSAPPPEPPASERVWKAAGLGPRPVRSPR
jgi:hypothetical protein